MELVHVISCDAFRAAQKERLRIFTKWVSLMVSGLRMGADYFPDGLQMDACPLTAHLSLAYPGFVTEFEFGEDRENFVMYIESDAFQYDPQLHRLYLQNGGHREYLRKNHRVAEEEIPAMRDLFMRIARLAQSGLPSDNLRADILATGLFAYFLEEESSPPDSSAVILKRLIDDDRSFRLTLHDHARAMGRSADVLRREFTAQFGITPGEYRDRQRRKELLSRITYTHDSLKEIAASLGLKHVQHLNWLVNKYFQCTPKELVAQCRHPYQYVSSRDGAPSVQAAGDSQED